MARPSRLTESQIGERLGKAPGWEIVDSKLHRVFTFKDFVGAFGFMSSLALVAEAKNHHPTWSNVYSRVVVDLDTHDVGGITQLDFDLAAAANEIYDR